MGKIYLVRHGETEWNKQQRSQGCSNDIPLSEEGLGQALQLGERLKNVNFDLICASKLQRAYQTASKIAEYHKMKVETFDEFMEINFGIWEGRRVPEIKAEYSEAFECWRNSPDEAVIEGAESLKLVQKRCMNKLNDLIKENPNGNILIVSHGISIKVMIASIIGLKLGDIHRIRQDNTALNIFDYNGGIMDIITINDVSHLEYSGILKQGSFEMK